MTFLKERKTGFEKAAACLGALALLAALALKMQGVLEHKPVDVSAREPVAKLSFRVKSVQRKFDREVLWNPVQGEETLYNHDSIRTDGQSEARVAFDDGTVLELAENSLVILDRDSDSIGVNFLKGSVFARAGDGGAGSRKIEIQTANGKISASKSSALSLTTGASGVEVTVAEGQADLTTAKGRASIGANEKGQVGAGGIEKRKLEMWPKSPVPNARLILNQEAELEIPFEWEIAGGAGGARLQIALDPEFEKRVHDQSGQKRLAVRLKEGTYYWRIAKQEGEKIVDASERRTIRVLKHAMVKLDQPEPDSQVLFVREKPSVKIAWRSLERLLASARGGSENIASGESRVEVARDAEFRQPVRPTGLTPGRGEAYFQGMEPGDYYWRVVSRYEQVGVDGKRAIEIPTPYRRFQVARSPRLPSPRLSEPEAGAVIGLSQDQKAISFLWEPVNEARGYRFRLATDPGFEAPIVDQWVSSPRWEGEVRATGTLYWSAQAVFGSSKAERTEADSMLAKPVMIQLAREGGFKLISPKAGEARSYLGEKPEMLFAWERVGGTNEYEIQVSDSPRFEEVAFSESVSVSVEDGRLPTFRTKDAPAGGKFWRVRALTPGVKLIGGGGKLLALSETGRYSVNPAPLLKAPAKASPSAQAVFALKNPDSPPLVRFQWVAAPGAIGYEISAQSQNPAGKRELAFAEVIPAKPGEDKPSFDRRLEPGVYFWDVRAIDGGRRKGEAGAPRLVEIRRPEALAAPLLSAPAYNARIESSTPRSIKLEWEKVANAEKYVVALKRLEKDGNWAKVSEQYVEDTELAVPESLPSGRYRWEVAGFGVAEGAKDKTPKAGNPAMGQFTVNWLGVLRAPAKMRVKVESDDEGAGGASK